MSIISEQVARATSLSPRDVSFNTNFNLPNGLGTKDVDIHHSGEILADRAAAELREKYGNLPQDLINTIRDRINYSVKANEGKKEDQQSTHQSRMKAIKEAQKMATAIAQAEAMAMPEGEKIPVAIQQEHAMPQGQAMMQGQPVRHKNAMQNPQAQPYRQNLQQHLSQEMAYNDISIDAFFK
jgi:hypothetical protein